MKGQRISELELVGLVKAGGEFTALATGLQNRSFLLKKGDRLLDGRVLEIRGDRVIFVQEVDDSTAGKRSSRVVKKLHSASGETSHGNEK